MQVIFETPRLILRQFTVDDASLIFLLNSNAEIVKYVHEPVLQTKAQAKNVLTNIILPQYKNKLGRWAVHTKSNMDFIGWCGLKLFPKTNEFDLGFRLLQSAWGMGYATEAAQNSLLYGFNTLNIKIITGSAHISNIASIKVLEKIGMNFLRTEVVDGYPVKLFIKTNPGL